MAVPWLNPAGGLRYHARAWFGARRWAPFHTALASWLTAFKPRVSRAVLVGPSAGYSFPDAFLRRFTALTVLEPDPIAGYLLTRRLRRLGVSELRLESQDRFLCAESEFERFKSAFRERVTPLLDSRSWLSFHDRLSGALAPSFSAPFYAPERLDDVAVLRELSAERPAGPALALFDHHSDGFFPGSLPHAYFSWQIDATHHHLIEGVAVSR